MKTKHTKGEWYPCHITGTDNYSVRTNERPELIIVPLKLTDVNKSIHRELRNEALANAKLIATAPELLNALILIKECLSDWDNGTGKYKNLICHAEKFIEKATE